jgi:hypothetical protein
MFMVPYTLSAADTFADTAADEIAAIQAAALTKDANFFISSSLRKL